MIWEVDVVLGHQGFSNKGKDSREKADGGGVQGGLMLRSIVIDELFSNS